MLSLSSLLLLLLLVVVLVVVLVRVRVRVLVVVAGAAAGAAAGAGGGAGGVVVGAFSWHVGNTPKGNPCASNGFLDDTHSSLWLQDADATWRLASRIFQGLRGVMNCCPLTSNQLQSQYFFTCFIRKLRSFPMFYPHSPFIHLPFLLPSFPPPTDLLSCPYLSGQDGQDGQAEAGQLRMRSSELVCCQVNALQVRDAVRLGVQPSLWFISNLSHVLTTCGVLVD